MKKWLYHIVIHCQINLFNPFTLLYECPTIQTALFIYTNDVNNNIVTGNGCEKYGKVFATVSANSS